MSTCDMQCAMREGVWQGYGVLPYWASLQPPWNSILKEEYKFKAFKPGRLLGKIIYLVMKYCKSLEF